MGNRRFPTENWSYFDAYENPRAAQALIRERMKFELALLYDYIIFMLKKLIAKTVRAQRTVCASSSSSQGIKKKNNRKKKRTF